MGFPFPHIEKKEIFQSTFLNEVSLKVFLPKNRNEVSYSQAKTFFEDLFRLDFNEIHYQRMIETRLKVGNPAQGVVFEFSRNSVKISVNQQHYNSFGTSMLPLISKFLDCYKKWFDYCDKIELKFVDVWPLADKKNLTKAELTSLEDAIFSSALRSESERLDENFKSVSYKDMEYSLVLKYGYYIPAPDDVNANSGIALESKCELNNGKTIPNKEIVSVAKELNCILYDAFIWSVTPTILEAMREKH